MRSHGFGDNDLYKSLNQKKPNEKTFDEVVAEGVEKRKKELAEQAERLKNQGN